MNKLKLIAVESPFLITAIAKPLIGCVLKDNKIYMYSTTGKLLNSKEFNKYIEVVKHVVSEGRYEWCDIDISEGQIISRNYDLDILIDNHSKKPFSKLVSTGTTDYSNITLKLFNEFLKFTSKDNKDMVEAIDISFKDGFFREEVNNIISNDEVADLSNLDKEIIIGCKFKGKDYIIQYVKDLLSSENYQKYIDINYFFRRIFNLERNNYIRFE